ncbi:MAG: hypothetical protein HZB37_01410 [Planctomycetes bacterium]|nr:hypothetical protein [Planctomycetota bacterium]
MIYLILGLGLILVAILSSATSGLWGKYADAKIIKVFLLPGSIVHDLSHALVCLITGTTIKELNLFALDDSEIKYDKPKIPVVFDFLIVAAPIFGCAFFIFFISTILGSPIRFSQPINYEFHFSLYGLFNIIKYLYIAVVTTFYTFHRQFHVTNISHIFFLLTVLVFSFSMAPKKEDIKYLLLGFFVLALTFFCLEKFGVRLLKYSWWRFCIHDLWAITVLSLCALIFLFSTTLIIMGVVAGYRSTIGRKGSGGGKGAKDKGDGNKSAANKSARK